MAGVSGAQLAVAVTQAGAMGTIGVGSTTSVEWLTKQISFAQTSGVRYGIGLMAWALKARPELLEISLDAKPALISVSFGEYQQYIKKIKDNGIVATTQIGRASELKEATESGIDFVVIRGSEAGGHGLNDVTTLTLLQEALDLAEIPVVVGGGISTGRGLAAVLAAGGAGCWLGTALLTCEEAMTEPEARAKILAASTTDTIYTRVFDLGNEIPWPQSFGGRAIKNKYTQQWHGHEEELALDHAAKHQLQQANKNKDYEIAQIYAGQGVGLLKKQLAAVELLQNMATETEQLIRALTLK